MKRFLVPLAAAAAASFATAQAAVLDFAAEGAANERGIANGAAGVSNLALSGYNLRLTATNTATGAAYYSYLDDGSDAQGAGLGVCKSVTMSLQCTPSSDDNVTAAETVAIEFLDGPVNIDAMDFRQEGHIPFSGASLLDTLRISVNGAASIQYTFQAALLASFLNVSSIAFSFDDGANSADQFYLSSLTVSDVPVPAALPLLLTGLAGFSFSVRQRRA